MSTESTIMKQTVESSENVANVLYSTKPEEELRAAFKIYTKNTSMKEVLGKVQTKIKNTYGVDFTEDTDHVFSAKILLKKTATENNKPEIINAARVKIRAITKDKVSISVFLPYRKKYNIETLRDSLLGAKAIATILKNVLTQASISHTENKMWDDDNLDTSYFCDHCFQNPEE